MVWVCILVIVALQVFIVYTPGVNAFFSIDSMDGPQWGIAILFGVLTFFVVEAEKALVKPLWRATIEPCVCSWRRSYQ